MGICINIISFLFLYQGSLWSEPQACNDVGENLANAIVTRFQGIFPLPLRQQFPFFDFCRKYHDHCWKTITAIENQLAIWIIVSIRFD